MRKRDVIYIAGKYSADTKEEINQNIKKAEDVAKQLLEWGFAPICPHTMSRGWEDDPRFEWGDFMAMDFAIIDRVDAVLLLDNWTTSPGAIEEKKHAEELGIPVLESLEELRLYILKKSLAEIIQQNEEDQKNKAENTLKETVDSVKSMVKDFFGLDDSFDERLEDIIMVHLVIKVLDCISGSLPPLPNNSDKVASGFEQESKKGEEDSSNVLFDIFSFLADFWEGDN